MIFGEFHTFLIVLDHPKNPVKSTMIGPEINQKLFQ